MSVYFMIWFHNVENINLELFSNFLSLIVMSFVRPTLLDWTVRHVNNAYGRNVNSRVISF